MLVFLVLKYEYIIYEYGGKNGVNVYCMVLLKNKF